MKMTVKSKMPAKAKAGQLLASHIEYDSDGDGASVMHEHAPEEGKKSEPWSPGPSMHKKSFSSRMEAHHHMAQMGGVKASMDDGEGDPNEDPEESEGVEPEPAAEPKLTADKGKKKA